MADDDLDKYYRELQKLADQAERISIKCGVRCAGVLVIASIDHVDGSACTSLASAGAGNYHARLAAADEWVRAKKSYEAGYEQERGARDARDHE